MEGDYLKGGTGRGRDWICSMSHRDTEKSICLPSEKSEGLYFLMCFFTTRCRQIPLAGAEVSTFARAHYYLQVNECLWKTAASVAARKREFRPNRPADGPAESYLLFMRTSYDGAVH